MERQLRMTERSIRAVVWELAKQQEMVAVWNDTVQQLSKPIPDQKWLDNNVGPWLSRTFAQDQVYILDPRNIPINAARDGMSVSPHEYETLRPELEKFINELRDSSSHHQHNSVPPADEDYLTSGRAIYHAHLLRLGDRPAAVSAMKIVPENDDLLLEPGREFILVSIRFLDGSFIRQISEQNLIEGLRFSKVDDPREDEISVSLVSDNGNQIGYFIWRPELPGTAIFKVLGPSVGLVCSLMIVVMVFLLRSLRRSMKGLKRAVVELRASEAQAHHLAYHDALTGLPNRALFEDKLDRVLASIRRDEQVAVLMLDLDRFKNVNDTLGHQAGDQVVQEFSSRLLAILGSNEAIARLGGDEFSIVLRGIHGLQNIEAICSRILNSVRKPFDIAGRQAFVGVSIGVALSSEADSERSDLLRKADIALYQAKAEGRNAYRIFTAAMDEGVKARSSIEEELRAALADGRQFKVFYQPQVDVATYSLIGLEALVRWHHPTQGIVSPGQFISIAEEAGLISALGEWVLKQACLVSKRWPHLSVSVNLSPVQFRSEDLAKRLITIVRETGADSRKIEFEITESLLLSDSELSRSTLKALREEGFTIALDDFGTGYSSLSYLRRFGVDKIKIDRSFVQHIGQQDDAIAIVTAIVSLCQGMGLTVIAEGIETEEQKAFLFQIGCRQMQGYLFSHAVPEGQIQDLVEHFQTALTAKNAAGPNLPGMD